MALPAAAPSVAPAGRSPRPLRGAAVLLAAIVLATIRAPSALAADPRPQPSGGAQEAAKPYRLDLASGTDFVAQTNLVQCVGASMQMMLNMIRSRDDRTAATQLELQQIARRLSPSRPDGRIRQGASVRGWTDGLNQLGAGPYTLVGADSIEEALAHAARAIRNTGRPVGLLMWRGRHAWVMSGFRATADPALTNRFTVTEAIVLDPLYPRSSPTWGRSPKPRQSLTVAQLGRQFVRRRSGSSASQWLAGYGGKYVIVMPYEAHAFAAHLHIAS